LCALVPRLLWCSRFELSAVCEAGPGISPLMLVVRNGDPLRPGRELRPFDSKLEQRFARDFRKAARDWDIVREPRPVETESSLLFPDFELVHRRDPSRRILLEIVGFWTPKYLEEKLRKLQEAKLDNVILCIDEALNCAGAQLPKHTAIVRYKRRIDVSAVLAVLEARA
jgi:predicted nuclease of restriction endonuclease-like RecB superfamily